MEIIAAIRALAALPGAINALAKTLDAFNRQLAKAEAQARLENKRSRNADAIASVLRGDAPP